MNIIMDVIIAVIIDWIIGDPYWFPHPVIYIGKLIRFLERKVRHYSNSDKALKIGGGLIVLTVALASFGIPFALLKLAVGSPVLYHILNVFMLWTTLAAKSLHVEGKKVYTALRFSTIEEARVKLSYIVGRDTKNLSENEIIRADVETIAENTSDGIIAPLLFGILYGAPLAMLYKGINTMDSMLGYMNPKYKHIGFFPAKVDDVFNFIPARVTGLVMCLAGIFLGGNPFKTFKIMLRDRKNHKSPNCAYPEGATAAALGLQLGGTNVYFGEVMEKPTIGDKLRELDKEDIVRSIKLMYITEVITIVVAAGILMVII